jgi:hypothetical protein
MLVKLPKNGRRLVTLGISNDSNQIGAQKCFMSSSPAAKVTNFVGTNVCEFQNACFFVSGHVLFRAKIGVVDRNVLACVVLLASQFGVVKATCVAECAGSVGSTSPLRCFGTVTTVTAARRGRTSSALFRIRACESRFHVVLVGACGHDRFGISFLLLALLCSLLVVSQLLCNDDLADL